MEHAEETLINLVNQRLKALNTNAFAVETSAGMPEDTIRSILRGGKKSGTTLNKAKAVCDALGIEFHLGPRPPPEPVGHFLIDSSAFSQIPVHDAMLAAGAGALNGEAAIVSHLAFRTDWLSKMGVSPNSARIARAHGDSMAPGISDGDLVLMDTAKSLSDVPRRAPKDRRPSPIFAFLQDGEARVKRLERAGDKFIVLHSDNPAFPAETVDIGRADFKMLGQVVWSGHIWR